MQEHKKTRIAQVLAAIFACTTIFCGLLTAQSSANFSQLSAQYQTLEDRLSDAKGGAQPDAGISQEELESYNDKIAALEAQAASQSSQIDTLTTQNAALSTELGNRQAQIDNLWSRVDAAQKNLDTAYAKLESRQGSAAVSAGNTDAGTKASTSQTVYITNTGSKYHRSGCQYLRKSKISISLDQAKSQGYTSCSRCF